MDVVDDDVVHTNNDVSAQEEGSHIHDMNGLEIHPSPYNALENAHGDNNEDNQQKKTKRQKLEDEKRQKENMEKLAERDDRHQKAYLAQVAADLNKVQGEGGDMSGVADNIHSLIDAANGGFLGIMAGKSMEASEDPKQDTRRESAAVEDQLRPIRNN